MTWHIKVTRTDDTVRDVEIMYDRKAKKFAFVNLTSHHVCECRFNSVADAMDDLMHDKNVKSFNVDNITEESIKF